MDSGRFTLFSFPDRGFHNLITEHDEADSRLLRRSYNYLWHTIVIKQAWSPTLSYIRRVICFANCCITGVIFLEGLGI